MTSLTRITARFAALAESGGMAFMPFVTAGDPDLETTLAVIGELSSRGVDLIEVGFPYSDPIADGPVIQASYQRALESGLRVDEIFERIGELDRASTAPLVAMVSYAIIFRRGPKEFIGRAAESGFSGLIVPDLPGEESVELSELAVAAGLDLIQLVSPTTGPSRLDAILSSATGFLYCITVAGTTGARESLPSELSSQLEDLRSRTELPLAVGFGISTLEHIGSLRGVADGAIVGSALVGRLEAIAVDGEDRCEVLGRVGDWIETLVTAAHS
ncbi:MAG: tryptophan synthase subunit alpha [Planctomycetaceae bacterium]